MPHLIFYVENGYPRIANLDGRKTSIGRSEDNSIVLEDARVSDHHAEIVRKGDAMYQLIDLKSDNGCAVNGTLVDEIDLRDGDEIKLGSVNATYVDFSESIEDKLLRKTVERDLQSKIDRLSKIEQTIENRTQVLNEIAESQGKLESLEAARTRVTQQFEIEQAKLTKLQNEIETAQQKSTNVKSEVATLEQELAGMENDRNEVHRDYTHTRQAYENSVKLKYESHLELEELFKSIEAEKNSLRKNREAIELAKSVINQGNTLQNRLAEFESRLSSCKDSYEQIGKQIAERETIHAELGTHIETHQASIEELTETATSKQKGLEELDSEIHQKKEELQATCDLLEGMESTLEKEAEVLTESHQTQHSLAKENKSLSHLIKGKTVILRRLADKLTARENGITSEEICPPLRVVDPSMSSLVQYFQHGAGLPDQNRSNPLGHSALAACTFGSEHRDVDTIPDGDEPILVILHGEMVQDSELLSTITRDLPNRPLLVCWREGSLHESMDAKSIKALLTNVFGIISTDSTSAEIIDDLNLGWPHLNLIQPCPVESPDWNKPTDRRSRGIFVSVNGFDPASKSHCNRLELLNQVVDATRTSVTLYHPELVPALIEQLQIPNLISTLKPLPTYGEYLDFTRSHSFMMSFGANVHGGDVLSDSVLSRNIYLGASFSSVIGQILYPEFSAKNGTFDTALESAISVTNDKEAFKSTADKVQNLAQEVVSFQAVSQLLREFIYNRPEE